MLVIKSTSGRRLRLVIHSCRFILSATSLTLPSYLLIVNKTRTFIILSIIITFVLLFVTIDALYTAEETRLISRYYDLISGVVSFQQLLVLLSLLLATLFFLI